MKQKMPIQRLKSSLLIAMFLLGVGLQAVAQTPTDDTVALEAQIKLKELQLKMLQAEQNLKDAELKALDQSRKEVAAQRLLGRQADAEKLLDVQATGAVSGAQVANDLQLVAKLKETFGDVPRIGKEGAVSITDGSTTQLLSTRSGSALAALKFANQICDDLVAAGIKDAYVAPAGFDEKVVRSRLFKAEVDSLKKYADDQKAVLEGAALQSVAAIATGMQVARYLIGGAQELSKTFRADYSFAIANSTRAVLIEKSIAARCPAELANTDLETSLRLGMDSSPLSDSLSTLINFSDRYDGTLAATTSQISAAKERLAAEMAKPEKKRSKATIENEDHNAKSLQQELKKLQLVEPAVKRVKTFLESLKTRQTEVVDALVWADFDNKWRSKPRLQLTVSAQDVQITKTSAWTNQKILAATHIEVLYHAIDNFGKVLISGARVHSVTSPELELAKPGNDLYIGCVVVPKGATCP